MAGGEAPPGNMAPWPARESLSRRRRENVSCWISPRQNPSRYITAWCHPPYLVPSSKSAVCAAGRPLPRAGARGRATRGDRGGPASPRSLALARRGAPGLLHAGQVVAVVRDLPGARLQEVVGACSRSRSSCMGGSPGDWWPPCGWSSRRWRCGGPGGAAAGGATGIGRWRNLQGERRWTSTRGRRRPRLLLDTRLPAGSGGTGPAVTGKWRRSWW